MPFRCLVKDKGLHGPPAVMLGLQLIGQRQTHCDQRPAANLEGLLSGEKTISVRERTFLTVPKIDHERAQSPGSVAVPEPAGWCMLVCCRPRRETGQEDL